MILGAVLDGDTKKVAELIRQNPDFNVNMRPNGAGNTLLHFACLGIHRSAVIPLLLAHPDIDVNLRDDYGCNPFDYACNGRASCVREMLRHSRVKVNEPDVNGSSPLWYAANNGNLDVIKWWIVSGREMDLGKRENEETDAIGVAKERGHTEVVTMLQRFKSDAAQIRHAMRVELGWCDELAAEVFALAVLVSDEFLKTKATCVKAGAKRTRFFKIAARLPLELQMLLCYRLAGSGKEIIPSTVSEVAFKSLAKSLLWSAIFTNWPHGNPHSSLGLSTPAFSSVFSFFILFFSFGLLLLVFLFGKCF